MSRTVLRETQGAIPWVYSPKVNLFVWGGSSRMEHTSYISGERYPIAFEALEEVLNTITRSRGRTRVLRAQGINRKMALTRPNCPPRLS